MYSGLFHVVSDHIRLFSAIGIALTALMYLMRLRMKAFPKWIVMSFCVFVTIYDCLGAIIWGYILIYEKFMSYITWKEFWNRAVIALFKGEGSLTGWIFTSVVSIDCCMEVSKYKSRIDSVPFQLGDSAGFLDLKSFYRMYKKDADKDPGSAYGLALCYYRGLGTEKDLPKALFWTNKALKTKDKKQYESVLKLKKDILSEMGKRTEDIFLDLTDDLG